MVYESDFYTTRRPYSRPLVSSYSVTAPSGVVPLSTIIQLRSGHPRMPYIAHKRLVTVIHTPIRTVYHHGTLIPIRIHARVRPSVLAAELNRIRTLPRPTSESYIEKFLNSRDCIYFDDEAREIRARVDSLLRRVHVFVPRASPSDFAEEIIPERMRDDSYIRRLISGKSNAKKEADPVSWYDVPERGNFGNLACVKYVAGKPQSIRRPYYKVADLRPSDIKNDVNFLSYYKKNLQAAEHAFADQPMTEREIRKARALETEWSVQQKKKESKPEPVPELLEETEAEIVAEIVAEKVEHVMNGHAVEFEDPAPESEAVSEKKKKKKEKKQEENDVKHEKEEALKRAEAFLIKQTAAARMAEEKRYFEEMRRLQKEREQNDARLAEERQRAIDEERAKLELEEQKAWLAMKEAQEAKARILERHENERLEVLRKAEEEKAEKDRIESIRVAEEEKQAVATALVATIEERERIAAEECLVDRTKRAAEDRLAEIATVEGKEDPKDFDKSLDEPLTIEETDQEKEEQPYEIINVEDVHIEPEHQQDNQDISESPFVEEVDDIHEAGDAQPEVSAVVEDNAVTEEFWPSAEESAPVAGGEEAMPAEEVVEESAAVEETQEEAAPAVEAEEEQPTFDGTNEETIVTDGEEPEVVTSTVVEQEVVQEEQEEAATVEEKEDAENAEEPEEITAPVIEESIPADEIEETFEWGDQDA